MADELNSRPRKTLGWRAPLRGRALGGHDVLAGRLTRPGEPTRPDAGEHLLDDDACERVSVGEVPARLQTDLAAAVDCPHPLAMDADPAAAERDLAGLMVASCSIRDNLRGAIGAGGRGREAARADRAGPPPDSG
jgi:hypothetical protein